MNSHRKTHSLILQTNYRKNLLHQFTYISRLQCFLNKGCSRFFPGLGVGGISYMSRGVGVSTVILFSGGGCFYWDTVGGMPRPRPLSYFNYHSLPTVKKTWLGAHSILKLLLPSHKSPRLLFA